MATVKGVNRTKYDTPTPDNFVHGRNTGANLLVEYDTYELASLSANDVIELGNTLPDGALIVDIIVHHDALGTSTSLDIGDTNDVDRYLDGIDTTSAGSVSVADESDTAFTGVGYVVGTNSGDDQITAKLLGAAGTGTVHIYILYTHAS